MKKTASKYSTLSEGVCGSHCLSKRFQGAGKESSFLSHYFLTDAGKEEIAQGKRVVGS